MDFNGREIECLIAKGLTALERMSRATERSAEFQERLMELASQEPVTIEPGPPVCPYCGTFNPTVRSHERAGSGLMAEIVLFLECDACQMTFVAVPDGFISCQSPAEAKDVIEGRKGVTNGGSDRDNFERTRSDQREQSATENEAGPGGSRI